MLFRRFVYLLTLTGVLLFQITNDNYFGQFLLALWIALPLLSLALSLPGMTGCRLELSAAPAALLGLDKGTLSPGRDADLVIFDPDEAWVIDKEQFVSKGRNTPFHGRAVRGKVKYTISQGNIIYMEG